MLKQARSLYGVLALTVGVVIVGGCSDDPVPGDGGAPDATTDLGHVDLARDAAGDAPGDAPGVDDRQDLRLYLTDISKSEAVPPSPYTEARGLIHMHSIYSHDGCDGEGFISGKPNLQCLKELRDAVCQNGFDFMFLTDHPSNMKNYTLQQDMLHDAAAGDTLVLDKGKPIANKLACKGGTSVLVSVGFESLHMMPLGLHALPSTTPQDLYGGISDTSDKTKLKAQVAGLKAVGSVVAMVHSEEADISAATIDVGGFEAMEWYNIHASILLLLSKDLLSADITKIPQLATLVNKLIALGPFLTAGTSAPHPDLVYLLLLDTLPAGGFDKWRAVQKTRRITGVLGSDIHRNVSVDASMCTGALQIVCAGALLGVEALIGAKIPQAIKTLLLSGGTIDMSDGVRIDSYDRLMRWLENRLLVTKVGQLELQEALRKGRAYGVFTVFGDPAGFSFSATKAGAATALHLGDAAKGPLTLQVKAPALPVKMRGVAFTAAEAAKAELEVKLLRTDAAGTTTVATAKTLGALLTKQVSQPGAYHVEIWITPKHLTKALGTSSALGGKAYLWVITNPIVLTK
jgi:hypothetical protein